MIAGNDCVFALKIGETYEAVYCATAFSFNQTTNDIESTVHSDGRFRDFSYNTFTYTLTLDGLAKLGSVNSSFDVLIAQGGFVTLPYRLIYEDEAGSVRTFEGECIVVTSAFTGQADQGLEFSHTFQGKGDFNAFVDGEPNDGGEIPEDGGDGGGGVDGGGTGDCDVVINDGILDIIIIPDVPLSYNYRVTLSDIVGTWSYIAYRIDGGPWYYSESPEFVLPFLENGSYTLEIAPVCPNGVFGDSVFKTFDVFNEEPAACDGTIDGWSYTWYGNGDGTYTVTFTVEASSPSETLYNIQYKLDSGYDAGLWMTRPLVDGQAIFSAVLPSLTFEIDLRTVCSNGGFGFSVEDGGEIPEPTTCAVTIEILSYYLSYSLDGYSCQAIMTYTTSSPIEDVYQIQWFSTLTNEWELIADSTDPVISIPVVPGTIIQQQFRVACDSTHFGPVFTIPVTVPIKGLQLDSRVINYTDTDEYFYVYVNGNLLTQGFVHDNDIAEFNYVGLLNTPVTIKLTFADILPNVDTTTLITRNTEYSGTIDPGDDHSILFDVSITYGFAIVFWDVEEVIVEECATVIDFNGYAMTHDDTSGDWIITPIYTVTDNVDPTAVIEYWDGSTWVELGDADSFVPLHFSLADDTTVEVKLRAKCSEGVFGPESAPIEIVTPEFSTWEPENNATVINYSYSDQDATIKQDGVTIFTATLPARSSTEFNIAAWDSGMEISITTFPGYPALATDTPDPTSTWYTAIWEGDSIKGSYAHDPGDAYTILVNGAGVDLAHGVVFTIQTQDEAVEYPCELEFTDLDYGIARLYSGGDYIWYVQYVFSIDAEPEDFGTNVRRDGIEDFIPVVTNLVYAHSTIANDSTSDIVFEAVCVGSGLPGPETHLEVIVPDAATYTPTYNASVFNYKETSETVTIYADSDATPILAYTGTIPARSVVHFDFPTGLSGTQTKVTLGTGFPDPLTDGAPLVPGMLLMQTVWGYDAYAIVDPGDAHSLLFNQVASGDLQYNIIFSVL